MAQFMARIFATERMNADIDMVIFARCHGHMALRREVRGGLAYAKFEYGNLYKFFLLCRPAETLISAREYAGEEGDLSTQTADGGSLSSSSRPAHGNGNGNRRPRLMLFPRPLENRQSGPLGGRAPGYCTGCGIVPYRSHQDAGDARQYPLLILPEHVVGDADIGHRSYATNQIERY